MLKCLQNWLKNFVTLNYVNGMSVNIANYVCLELVDLCFISINRLSKLGLVSSLSDISLLMSTCLK